MFSFPTEIESELSHIELAFIQFDQWNLTVSIRKYNTDRTIGMAQIIFSGTSGFRYLDEGDMLKYPFPNSATRHYLHHIESGGWLNQELEYGNTVSMDAKEYLVATENECLCIAAYDEPLLLRHI